MMLRNLTRFQTCMFSAKDAGERAFRVLVVKGTFTIAAGARVRPAPKAAEVLLTSRYHGEIGASSMYLASDLVPFKPRADIHIHAVAHAPSGLPAPSWPVRAQIGSLEKRLRVTGPRAWEKDGGGRWRLSEPEPCMQVPVRYENAFGGVFADGWRERRRYRANPVGRGYVPEGREPGESPWPAPRIEAADEPIEEPGRAYRPEGLGPLDVAWEPRASRLGTRDEAWRAERFPRLPLDFDFAYHNSAHPDLIHPEYLRGDEEVTLEGLHPDGDLRFSLPARRVFLVLRLHDGPILPLAARLDTLVIDVPEGLVHLTWRASFEKSVGVRVLEVRSIEPPEAAAEATRRAEAG